MKFVLVINVADDVAEAYEDFTVDYDLRGTPKEDRTVNESIKYVEDADVRPLPQKIEGKREKFMPTYSLGWNDCLDAVELGLQPLWEKTE